MGTPHIFDKGMSCLSTSAELFYFDDNFRQIALWVLALRVVSNVLGCAICLTPSWGRAALAPEATQIIPLYIHLIVNDILTNA